eukprot:scaffold1328_cov394-Prasinococcus_capsulatus_cf.AAC.38
MPRCSPPLSVKSSRLADPGLLPHFGDQCGAVAAPRWATLDSSHSCPCVRKTCSRPASEEESRMGNAEAAGE